MVCAEEGLRIFWTKDAEDGAVNRRKSSDKICG